MKKRIVLFLLSALASLSLFVACGKKEEEVTAYYISAELFDDFTVKAKMTVDYYNDTEAEIDELKFNLFPRAFREGAKFSPSLPENEARSYPHGKSYGDIVIESCGDCFCEIAGEDENILVLSLKKGVFPGERARVEIEFSLFLAECALRLGYTDGFINLGNWYPVLCARRGGDFVECNYSAIGDPFISCVADYELAFTAGGEYTVAAGGECVSTAVDGDKTEYRFKLRNARDLALSLSKNYNVIQKTAGDKKVEVFFSDCPFAEDIASAAAEALTTFSAMFGDYPYPSLAVAVTRFLHGGMEYPSLVFVSDALEKEDAIAAAVHEVAHQWWYAAVGFDEVNEPFLDEGLAEYSVVLFFEEHPEYGYTREGLMDMKTAGFRAFYGAFQSQGVTVNVKMDRPLSSFKSDYEYAEICYGRSALMFDGFREGVGRKRFIAALKRFYEDNLFSIADKDALIFAMSRAAGDAESYFDAWIDGKAIV